MDFNIYLFIVKLNTINSFLHCFKIFDFYVYTYMFYIVLFIMNIVYGHFHNQWYTFEIHIILTYIINIEVLDSNLPTWSYTSQVMLPWVA